MDTIDYHCGYVHKGNKFFLSDVGFLSGFLYILDRGKIVLIDDHNSQRYTDYLRQCDNHHRIKEAELKDLKLAEALSRLENPAAVDQKRIPWWKFW